MELNKEKYLALKGSRKTLANALLKDSDRFLFLDIEEIASDLNTTPSTLSRIVRAIGFENFKEFRTWIATKSGLILPDTDQEERKDDSLLKDELKGIEALSCPEVMNKIDEAAQIIAAKGKVIVAGFGPATAGILGELLKSHLESLGIRCMTSVNSKHDCISAAHALGENFLLLYVDFVGFSKEAIETLEIFKERQIPRIAFTCEPMSQAGILSSLVVSCKIEKHYHFPPMAPFIAAMDLLAEKISQIKTNEAALKKQLQKSILEDKDLYPPVS